MAESPAIDGTGFPHTQRKFRNAGGWQMLRTWRRPGNGTPGHWLTMFCERYNDYSVIERSISSSPSKRKTCRQPVLAERHLGSAGGWLKKFS